ncbi:hypothetical protein Slin_6759 (plasmid) [Spirosoma linguale DSM 74]|uniref:Transposase n=2 Tax=Spirosoma TaxID=107 RepID=D2QV81_SPILD|nr:hypothetical protein Slin_6759 [Spirosoma linguale DSM 74]
MLTINSQLMDRLVKLRMKQPKRIMREMAAAVLLGQLNIDQAAERYKVNRMTVLRWIRKIEEEAKAKKQAASTDPDLLPPSSRKSNRPSTPEDQVNQLRAKVRSLEEELETANFKTLYYSTLVRVAKHELGVDIEKKSVTKPSGSC